MGYSIDTHTYTHIHTYMQVGTRYNLRSLITGNLYLDTQMYCVQIKKQGFICYYI